MPLIEEGIVPDFNLGAKGLELHQVGKTEKRALAAILLAFFVLALAGSAINPLHEATDELRHYRFVRHLAVRHTLPVQGEEGCRMQSHHPPLFYALGALATAWIDTGRDLCYAPPQNPFWAYRYWEVGRDNKNQYLHGLDEAFPWHGEALAAHLIRALNVLIGAGVVVVTWALGCTIWPRRPFLALGAAAFVAFNPMFVYMAGAINNDVIAALSGSAVTLACARLLGDERGLSRRWGVTLGILYGLALMCKFNLAVIAALIGVVVTWVAWRRRQWRMWWQAAALILLLTGLLAGWWFLRNQVLYGESTGFRRLTELWGVRNPTNSFGLAVSELPYAWTSLWGRFGYGQIPLPETIYRGLRWVAAVAGLGLLIPLIRRRGDEWKDAAPLLTLLVLTVLLFSGVLFGYLLVSPAGPMGRFFFPALPALALLMFYGLSRWVDIFSSRFRRRGEVEREPDYRRFAALALVANLGMAGLTAVALFGYLAPAYARPPRFDADASVPNPVDAQFDVLVKLRGYEVIQTAAQPGGAIDIDLYWEVTAQPPGDYLLFVHLIDDTGTIVAQRDTHPGLGNFPSRLWRPGNRFVESIRLPIPETAYVPTKATLSVGLYAPGAYRLGITGPDGAGLGDALTLTSIALNPADSTQPNPQDHSFEDEVRLVGYEYNQRELRPDESLQVTLYWEAMRPRAGGYLVQVRLLDESGGLRAIADGPLPAEGWTAGSIVQDVHQVPPGDTPLPSGFYRIHIAVLDTMTKEPLNIVADDGHWLADHLLLAAVRIRQ